MELALLVVILGGLMNGSFAVPTRYLKRLSVESIWFFHSIMGLIVIAWGIFFIMLPNQLSHFFSLSLAAILWILGGGIVFGLGQLFFARAINTIGIALSFSINLSIGIIIGSLFVAEFKGLLFTIHGAVILLAIVFIILGLFLYYVATKEKSLLTSKNYQKGWLWAVMAGIASGLQNISFVMVSFQSASDFSTQNSYWFWPPFLSIAAIVMMIGFKREARNNAKSLVFPFMQEWALLFVMGLLFTGSLALYSYGMSHFTSNLGKVIGWPLLMVTIILASQLWGLKFREFRFRNSLSRYQVIISILLLITAIILLATQK